MKRNKVFMLGTALCACTLLAGCGGGGSGGGSKPTPVIPTQLTVSPVRTPNTFSVGETIKKFHFNVLAKFSNGSMRTLGEDQYSTYPALPLSLTEGLYSPGDEVKINFAFENLSQDVVCTVKAKQ